MHIERLWNITQLVKNYPALSEWGVRWLIRHRRIPIVRFNRRIFFDPEDIREWIGQHKIQPMNGGKKNERKSKMPPKA